MTTSPAAGLSTSFLAVPAPQPIRAARVGRERDTSPTEKDFAVVSKIRSSSCDLCALFAGRRGSYRLTIDEALTCYVARDEPYYDARGTYEFSTDDERN